MHPGAGAGYPGQAVGPQGGYPGYPGAGGYPGYPRPGAICLRGPGPGDSCARSGDCEQWIMEAFIVC